MLVLTDVDGTLVKSSLVLEHAGFLHNNGVIDCQDVYDNWKNDMKDENLIFNLSVMYREGIVGKKRSDLLIAEFFESFLNNDDKFYSTVEMIKGLQDDFNAVVYMISGSPLFLVDMLKDFLKFDKAFGSLYTRDNSGFYTGGIHLPLYSSLRKKEIVDSILIENNVVYSFGDTASDEPLWGVSDKGFVVAPYNYSDFDSSLILISE